MALSEQIEVIRQSDPMGDKAWDEAIHHAEGVVLDEHPELVDPNGRISDETDDRIIALAERTFLAWHSDNWSAFT